jgi:prefoldin subunit 5
VKERLVEEEGFNSAGGGGELAAVNAQLEVDLATLQSQISSLTSQLTALQLANSQLAAEKEEVTCSNLIE